MVTLIALLIAIGGVFEIVAGLLLIVVGIIYGIAGAIGGD